MLGEIVIDDQGMLAVISEILADRSTGEGRQELHGSRIARGGRHDDAVFHGMVLFERLDDAGDGRTFLADRDIDTKDAEALLIDDRIDGNGGLARLPVADDQLTLAAADGNHGIDGLDAGLQWFADRLTGIHTGRDDFDAGREGST